MAELTAVDCGFDIKCMIVQNEAIKQVRSTMDDGAFSLIMEF